MRNKKKEKEIISINNKLNVNKSLKIKRIRNLSKI